MFVLADMKPSFAGRISYRGTFFKYRAHADVHPVAGLSARLRCWLTYTGHEHGHAVAIQNSLEIVEVTLVDGALWEHHHIDTAGLVSGREDSAV